MNAERDLLVAFLQSSHANPEAWGRTPAGLAQWLIENGLAPEGSTATDDDAFTHLRSQYKLDYGHGSRKVTSSAPAPRSSMACSA